MLQDVFTCHRDGIAESKSYYYYTQI